MRVVIGVLLVCYRCVPRDACRNRYRYGCVRVGMGCRCGCVHVGMGAFMIDDACVTCHMMCVTSGICMRDTLIYLSVYLSVYLPVYLSVYPYKRI